MSQQLSIVILAAGEGSRMQSALPKVLHPLAGRPLLDYVLQAASSLNPANIIVVHGKNAKAIQAAFPPSYTIKPEITWALQPEPNGTAHAVQHALPHIPEDHYVLILNGDMPLISAKTLASLKSQAAAGSLSMVTTKIDNPTGYGRILRDEHGQVTAIIEEADADTAQKQIREINTNIYLALCKDLKRWLANIKCENQQSEYYLPDIVPLALKDRHIIHTISPTHPEEVMNVNTRQQLIFLERFFQEAQAKHIIDSGVTIVDPKRFDVRGNLFVAPDVFIDINVIFEGKVRIGSGAHIGAHCVIKDSEIGENVTVHSHSVIDGAHIGNSAHIGPFARLRPGTVVGNESRIGNFVETKKAQIGQGSKVNHLSYIGDATIGNQVNIGAGVITCNYDGANKHQTIIDDGAFIGSHTHIIAPVHVGENATIGAGTTLVKNAPANTLTLSRSEQRSVKHWKRPVKKPSEKQVSTPKAMES